jgi:hypothetical protein
MDTALWSRRFRLLSPVGETSARAAGILPIPKLLLESVSRPTHIRLSLLVTAALAFSATPPQAELPRDVILAHDIRVHMTAELKRVINYTCLETISRGKRAPDRLVIAVPGKSVPFRRTDSIRLEVAELDHKEMFARPGEHRFDDRDIMDFGLGGMIGNGVFTGFANDIFRSGAATYKWIGEEQVKGRKLAHFEYRIPEMVSQYSVGRNRRQYVVGYHGSFWADPQTFDAVRFDTFADDIPLEAGLTAAISSVELERVHIGGSDALLPQTSEMGMRASDGWEFQNKTDFTHCREYGVESVISFGDLNDPTGAKSAGSHMIDLPADVPLTIALETQVDSSTSHIGDVIVGRIAVDAKHRGKIVAPKDAVITGRIRHLDKHEEGWPYVLLDLELLKIEFEGKTARFFAVLEKINPPAGGERLKRVANTDLPGVGTITQMGNHLLLPAGTLMVWKTISYEQAAAAAEKK